jgi:large subunit ribosomal protein L6
MSRIGKQLIAVPAGVTVTLSPHTVSVKGPKGELSRTLSSHIEVAQNDNVVTVTPKSLNKFDRALWGTYASHIQNMIEGVRNGFTKKLVIEGIGYRVKLEGKNLVFALGFSHPVNVEVPPGITAVVEKNTVTFSGIDKEEVGQFSAYIRSLKKPEPYKGKGIRYDGEVVRRKQGKKSTA